MRKEKIRDIYIRREEREKARNGERKGKREIKEER
jgi:hypothetical protein